MNQDNLQRRSRSLQEYIEPYCNGSLSDEQTVEYEQLLRDDPRAMDEFVLYMEAARLECSCPGGRRTRPTDGYRRVENGARRI